MKKSIVVSGSGGQGVMSAGITAAEAAVSMGKWATYLPEYGPEQRGGSAKCTVMVSEDEIISPLTKKCDYLLVLNEQAYKKFGSTLKPGGVLIANSNRLVSEVKRTDITVVLIPADDICTELGNSKAANIVMLGALAAVSDVISKDALRENLAVKFASKKPEILELNYVALDRGFEAASK